MMSKARSRQSASNPLALAIGGQGFFAVSEQNGVVSGTTNPTFSPQTYYTRAGDFQMDQNGYLVNSAGGYLQGWSVDPTTGVANQSQLSTIQITQSQFNPVPTSTVNLSANLPTTAAAGTPVSSQVDVYDSLGNQHAITLSWAQNSANDWTVTAVLARQHARHDDRHRGGAVRCRRRPRRHDRHLRRHHRRRHRIRHHRQRAGDADAGRRFR